METNMVKTKGPIQSLTASGSLADVLTFAHTNRTPYAKKHAAPTNPRSPTQVSARAMVAFLAENWKRLSSANMATWFDRATQRKIANYHAYVGANTARWMNTRFPSKQDPATETPPPPTWANMTVFPTYRTANMRVNAPTGPIPWGLTVHRSMSSGFSWTRSNMIDVILQDVDDVVWWHDRDMQPGTYYYRIIAFNPSGLNANPSPQRSVTIA